MASLGKQPLLPVSPAPGATAAVSYRNKHRLSMSSDRPERRFLSGVRNDKLESCIRAPSVLGALLLRHSALAHFDKPSLVFDRWMLVAGELCLKYCPRQSMPLPTVRAPRAGAWPNHAS